MCLLFRVKHVVVFQRAGMLALFTRVGQAFHTTLLGTLGDGYEPPNDQTALKLHCSRPSPYSIILILILFPVVIAILVTNITVFIGEHVLLGPWFVGLSTRTLM